VLIGPANRLESHPFIFEPGSITGLFGHIWMHADFFHIFGNMLFLWIFGNAVCSRVSNLWFPQIYIGLGVMAALGQSVFSLGASVGASGAINGIIGMFLVLFPRSNIKLLYTVAYATGGTTRVSALWLIPAWFASDLIGAFSGERGIGYGAHIGGFLAGVVLAAAMLRVGWVRAYKGERTLPEILRLGWPAEDQKDSTPEACYPLLPREIPTHARGSEEAERTYEPLLDDHPNIKLPTLHSEGPCQYEPWRPAAGNVWLRCVCGSSLIFQPERAGKTVLCSRCGRKLTVPVPGEGSQADSKGRTA
jgi:membrane associated rhomboid family serine protease